jgi:hypothetical protein
MPTYEPVRPVALNSCSVGTRAIWIGTTISPTMNRKIVSRNGNLSQAKP